MDGMGISLQMYCDNNTIDGNDIRFNHGHGIFLDDGVNNTVEDNHVNANGLGSIISRGGDDGRGRTGGGPPPPENLDHTFGDGWIELSWVDPGYYPDYYKVFRGTKSGQCTYLATVPGGGDRFVILDEYFYNDTTVANGVTYYYNVTAVDYMGESPSTEEISAMAGVLPSAPQNVQVTKGTDWAHLTWNGPAYGGDPAFTEYTIYRGTMMGDLRYLATVVPPAARDPGLEYNDTGLMLDLFVYYYEVQATSPLGDSGGDFVTATLATSPWPQWQHDERHTGLSTIDTSHVDGTYHWSTYIGGRFSAPALGPDGTIYVIGESWPNYLYAFNPDGTEKWSFDTECDQLSSPAVGDDGRIYFVAEYYDRRALPQDNTICSVWPNGTLNWTYRPNNQWFLSGYQTPTLYNGVLYVEAHDSTGTNQGLAAIDADDGSLIWHNATLSDASNNFAVDPVNDLVFFTDGSGGDFCGALNIADGTEAWNFSSGDDETGSMAVGDDGRVFFLLSEGNFSAFWADTGVLDWDYPVMGSGWESPSIAPNGTVYFGSWDGGLYALNRRRHRLLPRHRSRWHHIFRLRRRILLRRCAQRDREVEHLL
jgi:parallel beta-helix repeat protein